MNKKIILFIATVPLLLVMIVGCRKKSAAPPLSVTPPQTANTPAERPVDPALLDDGLDEALKELDAVE